MNMKKNVLMMTLLAGALLVSSCASKKDLENCRMDNQNLLNENKELNTSYQLLAFAAFARQESCQ